MRESKRSRPVTQLVVALAGALLASSALAQQPAESHLLKVLKDQELRVCEWPGYYSISFMNPKTRQLEGIDIDLANELAKELGAKLTFVPSSFSTFAADLLTNKCDIAMFGVGATLARARAVEFSQPYLITSIYAVSRKDEKNITKWDDIDKPGVTVGAVLGSYVANFMKGYLKHAKLVEIQPPATREGELAAKRIDVAMTDYPVAHKFETEFDWARSIAPTEPLALTPYAYAVAPGDQRWLNYINLFVETIKLDGRLMKYAKKNGLGPIVVKAF
jgi:ABC-type amino acid transport substrate-binding protein